MTHKEESLHAPDEPKPKAVIFDIDGTLATNDGRRGWYEWDKVGSDKYIEESWEVLELYANSGYEILFVSGRSDECRKETIEWIERNPLGLSIKGALFMRSRQEQKGKVCDTIVKRRVFDQYVRDNYNVKAVFDDRTKVVKMWRELGLFTFDVNQTGKDF